MAMMNKKENALNEARIRHQGAGFVLVPVVPTRSMLDAAKESAWAEDAEGVWRDMIAAYLARPPDQTNG